MLKKPRPVRQGNLKFVSALPEMPRLSIGEEYLLFLLHPPRQQGRHGRQRGEQQRFVPRPGIRASERERG
jgi:hypothetical protein